MRERLAAGADVLERSQERRPAGGKSTVSLRVREEGTGGRLGHKVLCRAGEAPPTPFSLCSLMGALPTQHKVAKTALSAGNATPPVSASLSPQNPFIGSL